ncbi:DNA alkylation repair enzyme [bacterium BMS3Bbin04]|nr:DNA alkylation repair enzyme [bacterium BMS3Bbin04]
MKNASEKLVSEIRNHLDGMVDPEYAASLPTIMPGMTEFTGVAVPELRKLAREIRRDKGLKIPDWIDYLGVAFPTCHRELILVGLYGLDGRTSDLDDLFGERMSGWARHLDNWETTDALAPAAGIWVADDLSRIGYLESWANRGESVWKKRLAAVSTVYLSRHAAEHTHASLRVLRHLMEAKQPEIRKAVGWALRNQKDLEAVERFLAWWAPRVSRSLITEASEKLPEESRARLKVIVDEAG